MNNHYGYMHCRICRSPQMFEQDMTKTWVTQDGVKHIRDYLTCSVCKQYHYWKTRHFKGGIEIKNP